MILLFIGCFAEHLVFYNAAQSDVALRHDLIALYPMPLYVQKIASLFV